MISQLNPELVIEVEARMNRQHTPPNLNVLGLSSTPAGMSMNSCMNSQTRPLPKTSSRERRSGLATVGLATVLEGLRLGGLGIGTLFTFYFNTCCRLLRYI